MDKKDIYEHLAKIYLDASIKGKKRKKARAKLKNPFLISIVAALSLVGLLFLASTRNKPAKFSEVALVVSPDLIKINFDFNPAKKEVYTIDLNKLNMKRFRQLSFAAKRGNFNDSISLRVEFANAFRERAEVYLRHIPHKWQTYRISLADFKEIRDWSGMSALSFIVEEWNTKDKNGVVYIDNVNFVR